ncbi:MAG: hypothetical protein IIZ38_15290 [Sphingomonas sp.]|uniref:hypothetical protein n=1 Tax=Sphingomonas sp. TaxID=28214 RepID=UPI0025E84440|nr:hypothetical protein [Sphingomonas sp.]MBQ1499672.1 hypothetical protein [Sphingomonas sp.]
MKALTTAILLATTLPNVSFARDASELQCLDALETSAVGSVAFQVAHGGGPSLEAFGRMIQAKAKPCLDRYRWNGAVGDAAGRYFETIVMRDYLATELGKRDGALDRINMSVANMPADRRDRLISKALTSADKQWMRDEIRAAGLTTDATDLEMGTMYMLFSVRAPRMIEIWKTL